MTAVNVQRHALDTPRPEAQQRLVVVGRAGTVGMVGMVKPGGSVTPGGSCWAALLPPMRAAAP